jgi:hypothetical protein
MIYTPESKRIKNLRNSLIKIIPRSPNNKQSLQVLESKPLIDLLVVYSNWIIRFIPPRRRNIIISPMVKKDKKWHSLLGDILAFLDKVENGEDLKPNLSLLVRKKGFSYSPSKTCPNWEDKDMLLNVMGYHHFHLGKMQDDKDYVKQADDVLFAKVTRNVFEVLGIFNYKVFEMSREPSKTMPMERNRLYKIFEKHSQNALPYGITLDGHTLGNVLAMQDYVRVIKEIDPKLDYREYIKELFEKNNIPVPKKTNLIWNFRFLDLGVLDKRSNSYFVFRYGPN